MKSLKYEQIISEIELVIKNRQEFSLMTKLEFPITIKSDAELANLVVIINTLLEKSVYENAHNLLLRKVILAHKEFLIGQGQPNFKQKLFNTIVENAVYPFVKLSSSLRRFLTSRIYDKEEDQVVLNDIPKAKELLDYNIELLERYFSTSNPHATVALELVYNCIETIKQNDDYKIILDSQATRLYFRYLQEHKDFLDEYLSGFLRRYYSSSSADFPGSDLIVPEPFYREIFSNEHPLSETIEKVYEKKIPIVAKEIIRFLELYEQTQAPISEKGLELNIEAHKNLLKQPIGI